MHTPDRAPAAAQTSNRYAHVDALRGIAALLVIVLHVSEIFTRLPAVQHKGDWLYRFASAVDLGRLGVVIFFAISGFVICSSLQANTPHAVRNFAVKRFFRLYPAYWLAIALASFAVWHLANKPLSAGLYLANITMIPTIFGYKNMMGLLWTLETELVFYLACVLLFKLKQLHKIEALAVVCLLLLALFAVFQLVPALAPSQSPWRAMPYHLAIMFWGGIARVCHDNPTSTLSFTPFASPRQLLAATAAVLLLPLLAIAIFKATRHHSYKELSLAVAYLAGMSIFYAGTFHVRLSHRIFVWLGTISYSVYLFHPVIFTPMYVLARQHQAHALAQLHMSVYLVVTIALTLIVAHLIYRYIEAPSNRFARTLAKR